MLTAQQLFESSVIELPKSERLKLAALILDDLSQSGAAALDFSDSWSDEDIDDLRAFSLRCAEQCYPEEDGCA
jgi:hypothetical protein